MKKLLLVCVFALAATSTTGCVISDGDSSIEFFNEVSARIEADGPPPIGIHLLMGDNARDKLQNHVRNLSEERASVALGMAIKK